MSTFTIEQLTPTIGAEITGRRVFWITRSPACKRSIGTAGSSSVPVMPLTATSSSAGGTSPRAAAARGQIVE